jgi:hypothetical protein
MHCNLFLWCKVTLCCRTDYLTLLACALCSHASRDSASISHHDEPALQELFSSYGVPVLLWQLPDAAEYAPVRFVERPQSFFSTQHAIHGPRFYLSRTYMLLFFQTAKADADERRGVMTAVMAVTMPTGRRNRFASLYDSLPLPFAFNCEGCHQPYLWLLHGHTAHEVARAASESVSRAVRPRLCRRL